MGDEEPSSRIKNVISFAEDLVENNEEIIDEIMDKESSSIEVGDKQPLIKAEATEEAVTVNIEAEMAEATKFGIERKGDNLLLHLGEDTIKVQEVPGDVNMGSVRMRFKNGIAAVKIDRTNQDEGGE